MPCVAFSSTLKRPQIRHHLPCVSVSTKAGVAAATRDAYARALNALLLPGIASQLEEQLAGSSDDPSLSFELLKLYLML